MKAAVKKARFPSNNDIDASINDEVTIIKQLIFSSFTGACDAKKYN